MVLERAGTKLRAAALPVPEPGPGEILIKVAACGVCRTDLHIFDGELAQPKLPLVLGHEIVGHVAALGAGRRGLRRRRSRRRAVAGLHRRHVRLLPLRTGESLRPPALHRLPDRRRLCRSTRSPMRVTAFQLPEVYSDAEAAPLLCAGLIGYRSLKLAGDAQRLGIYGFGAAAHIVAQVARAKAARSTPSPGRATRRRRTSPAASAPYGPAARTTRRPSRSTRRSSSPRSARWCRRRCAPCARAASWCAAAST